MLELLCFVLAVLASPFFPRIREFEPREPFASDCQHSHQVAGLPALSYSSPKRPEEARNCATNWQWSCPKSAERRKSRRKEGYFSRFFSTGFFGGHTSRLCGLSRCPDQVYGKPAERVLS
jgi:hypothetical protein